MASASRLVSLALCLCLGAALHAAPRGAHAARAFFVFGDSLVDNGNNNYLLSEYAQVLARLHDLGARRVLVQGVGPIGCVPAELALHSADGACDPELQRAAEMYNPRLMALLADLNARLGAGGDPVFVGVNTHRIHNDFIDDPRAYGFQTATEACCGQGRFNGLGLCTVMSSLCADRDAYVFWDNFHPTERANRLIVQQFMYGTTDYIAPVNLSTVLAMDLRKQQLRT
ncbi:GDSL esterase/lipase LTL1 [Zea mays]|uniref:GDSL esterase/lipase LTL1 n=1 Tax=Zea mays TaxID=4577 RepID=A0A1D6HPB0_MAIZE|nr:GDSL esterase/lipase LTL1 [Zea mays]